MDFVSVDHHRSSRNSWIQGSHQLETGGTPGTGPSMIGASIFHFWSTFLALPGGRYLSLSDVLLRLRKALEHIGYWKAQAAVNFSQSCRCGDSCRKIRHGNLGFSLPVIYCNLLLVFEQCLYQISPSIFGQD